MKRKNTFPFFRTKKGVPNFLDKVKGFFKPKQSNQYVGPPRNRAERRAAKKKERKFVPTTPKPKSSVYHDELTDDELMEAEQAQIKALKKAQTSLKREITRRANKEFKNLVGNENAQEVNEALAYASSVYGGNNQYTMYLKSLMKNLTGDMSYKPQAGDENKYFKISDDYTGKEAELFKYVEFKSIPDDYAQDVEAIQDLDWSSSENYYSHLADIAHQKYVSNLGSMNITPQIIDNLEQIMNSSAAWHIACRWTDDSEQAKSNWLSIFDAGQKALNTSSDIFNSFCQMIRNEEDISVILDTVDDLIYKALKE